MTAFRETEEFRRGQTGERIVAECLQQRGYYIIPSYDYSGEDGNKAPKLQGLTDCHVIPDLDAARTGKRVWCEVKTKRAASFTRKTRRYEHGIPERHLNAYLQVERITGTPVHLVIYEETTGSILTQSVDEIDSIGRRSEMRKGGHSEGGMVYFPRDGMREIAKLPARADEPAA